MLARTSNITLPNGVTIQTPILISSFSSKGFRFIKKNNKIHSEAFNLIGVTAQSITEAALLSAYDLKYYYPPIKSLRKISFSPQVTFIDSGGYETIDSFDLSEAYRYPIDIKEWNVAFYKAELAKWPQYYPAIIVSYDHGSERRLKLRKQIERAEKLLQEFPQFAMDFLIKPEKKRDLLNINEIVGSISLFRNFKVIGMTEKELGISLLDRMLNIKKIREALDKVNNPAPLHIFGNLDPLTSILYFLSGAEIFDGLAWLRFSFHNGNSVYEQNIDAVKGRYAQKDSLNKQLSLVENVIYMGELKNQMLSFLREYREGRREDAFKVFIYNTDKIVQAIQTLYSK